MSPWLLRLLGVVLALAIVAALFVLAFLKAGMP